MFTDDRLISCLIPQWITVRVRGCVCVCVLSMSVCGPVLCVRGCLQEVANLQEPQCTGTTSEAGRCESNTEREEPVSNTEREEPVRNTQREGTCEEHRERGTL